MLDTVPIADFASAAARADLKCLLDAWQEATSRLEHTHAALQEEVGRLTHELEIKNRELARKNRLADLGQMAAHIAHEVRNNLVPVTLYLSLLRRRLENDPASRDIIGKVAAGCTALDALVNDLMQFTVDRDPQRVEIDLKPLIDEVLFSLHPQIEAQRLQTIVEVPPGTTLRADREMVRRALLNLILNALDEMPHGGRLSVSVAESVSEQGLPNALQITVADSGRGLSEEVLQRAFEPFFTTKNTGTGLGLAIVFRTAEAHGGQVLAQNQPSGGAAFTLHIPFHAPSTHPLAPSSHFARSAA